jgi:hypothetical protein
MLTQHTGLPPRDNGSAPPRKVAAGPVRGSIRKPR